MMQKNYNNLKKKVEKKLAELKKQSQPFKIRVLKLPHNHKLLNKENKETEDLDVMKPRWQEKGVKNS